MDGWEVRWYYKDTDMRKSQKLGVLAVALIVAVLAVWRLKAGAPSIEAQRAKLKAYARKINEW
jgi:hypothetical protein